MIFNYKILILYQLSSISSRLLFIEIEDENGTKMGLLNIYGPNKYKEKTLFVKEEIPNFLALLKLSGKSVDVILGDINMYKDGRIDKLPPTSTACKHGKIFFSYVENEGFVDLHRFKYKNKEFTRWNHNFTIASRIDVILVKNPELFTDVKLADNTLSDHTLITTSLINSRKPKNNKNVFWKLNTKSLESDEVILNINKVLQGLNNNVTFDDPCCNYIKSKKKVRNICIRQEKRINFYRNAISENKAELSKLLKNRLNNAWSKKACELRNLIYQHEYSQYNYKTNEDKMNYQLLNERPSKYFFGKILRHSSSNKNIELKIDGNTIPDSNVNEFMKEHYRRIYSKTKISKVQANKFLNVINNRQHCDIFKVITLEETSIKIKNSGSYSSPGQDGFPNDLYKTNIDQYSIALTKVFNDIRTSGKVHEEFKKINITLIYKNKGDKSCIDSYRPISLCDTDIKFLNSILNDRLKKISNQIFLSSQCGFIKGRSIFENIWVLKNILKTSKLELIPHGYVLQLDFSKAYDTISWKWLGMCLKKFNFDIEFIRYIKNLYKNTKAKLRLGDRTTDEFSIKRGVRQGDPLSPLLFNIAIEPLLLTLQNELNGIRIGDKQYNLLAYADDTTLILKDRSEVDKAIIILSNFEKASGLKLNMNKCSITPLGNSEEINREYGTLNLPIFRYLGVFFNKYGIDRQENENNLISNTSRISTLINKQWCSLVGKKILIGALIYSKLYYLSRVIPLDTNFFIKIKQLVKQALGSEKRYYSILHGPKSNGHFGLLNINDQCKSLYFKSLIETNFSNRVEISFMAVLSEFMNNRIKPEDFKSYLNDKGLKINQTNRNLKLKSDKKYFWEERSALKILKEFGFKVFPKLTINNLPGRENISVKLDTFGAGIIRSKYTTRIGRKFLEETISQIIPLNAVVGFEIDSKIWSLIQFSKVEPKIIAFALKLFNNKLLDSRIRKHFQEEDTLRCRWCNTHMDTILHRYFECRLVKKIWTNIIKSANINTEYIILFKGIKHDNVKEERIKVDAFLISIFEIHKAYFFELNQNKNISIYKTLFRIRMRLHDEFTSARATLTYGSSCNLMLQKFSG